MKPFTIGEVRDVFAADLAGFQSDIASLLLDALAHPDRPLDLTVGRRHAHTMKGMASLVGAGALTRWAVNLESLLIRAESVATASPKETEEILHWIVAQLPLWSEVCETTLREDFAAADAHYVSIRASLDELLATWPHESIPQPPLESPQLKSQVATHDESRAIEAPTPKSPDTQRPGTTAKIGPLGMLVPPPLAPPTLNKSVKTSTPTFKHGHTVDSKPVTPPTVQTPAFKKKAAPRPGPVDASDAQLQELCPKLLPPKLKVAAPSERTESVFTEIPNSENSENLIPPPISSLPTPDTGAAADAEDANAFLTGSSSPAPEAPIFIAKAVSRVRSGAEEFVVPGGEASSRLAQGYNAEMLAAFAQDARDQLEVLEQAVIRLEKGEAVEDQLAVARRCFHTLKGAANSVELPVLGQSFHEVEDFVETTSGKNDVPLPAGFCAFLLSCVDDLRRYVDRAEAGTASEWNCDWLSRIQSISGGAGMPVLAATPEPAAIPADPATAVVAEAPQIPGLAKAPAPAPKEVSAPPLEESQTIRVDALRLRSMMNLMGSLVIDRNRLDRQLIQLDAQYDQLSDSRMRVMQLVSNFQKEFEFNLLQHRDRNPRGGLRSLDTPAPGESDPEIVNLEPARTQPGSDFSELEFDRYDQFGIMARQLTEVANDLEEVIREMRQTQQALLLNHQKFTRTSKQMQDEATGLSLLPLSSLFKRLVRVFRDATQVEHKEAELQFEGESTLLDKAIMDAIYAPMLHLLRNAVAHGLEDVEGRAQAGKPSRGLVQIRAHASGSQVRIEVHDDGRGIDPNKVRARAIERGLLPPDSPDPLPLSDAVSLLFAPGFSTADKITSLSGRGVGLDVVRSEVESLGGVIQVVSQPGKGSVWIILLPLTLTVTEALLGSLDGRPYALPVSFLERGVIVNPERLFTRANGQEFYRVDNQELRVLYLSDLLGGQQRPAHPHGLVLKVGEQKALLVMEPGFIQQDIVVKPLDALITRHPFLSGATLDGEGNVFFILNVPGILQHGLSSQALSKAGTSRPASSARRTSRRTRVLVVDDSLSVRKVQERILSDLGCEVVTSNDGVQALEKLREQEFQLVLTDLEMPGMDGYQFISEIRSLPSYAHVPIVVVSSRSTARYTEKALTLGANACLTKPFTSEDIDSILDRFVRLHASEVIAA